MTDRLAGSGKRIVARMIRGWTYFHYIKITAQNLFDGVGPRALWPILFGKMAKFPDDANVTAVYFFVRGKIFIPEIIAFSIGQLRENQLWYEDCNKRDKPAPSEME